MPVITSYAGLRAGLARGILNYQAGHEVLGDRDGLIHQKQGRIRTALASRYLEYLQADHKLGLLALMYAIYKPNAKSFLGFFIDGRSSRLAGLIADQMITGDATFIYGYSEEESTLSSNVFDQGSLTAVNISRNRRTYPDAIGGGHSHLDRTKAVRALIAAAVAELPPTQRALVIHVGCKLQKILDSSNEQSFNDMVLPKENMPIPELPENQLQMFLR